MKAKAVEGQADSARKKVCVVLGSHAGRTNPGVRPKLVAGRCPTRVLLMSLSLSYFAEDAIKSQLAVIRV
jgi:hypothetical protein